MSTVPLPDSIGFVENGDFFVPRARLLTGQRSCPPPAPRKPRPSSRLPVAYGPASADAGCVGEPPQSRSGLYAPLPSESTSFDFSTQQERGGTINSSSGTSSNNGTSSNKDDKGTPVRTPQRQWALQRRGFIGTHGIPYTPEQRAVDQFARTPTSSAGDSSYFQRAFVLCGALTSGSLGSRADVYRVRSVATGRLYALKRAYDDTTAAVEAEIASAMQHAALVPVRSAWTENGFSYILMDLCGQTLAQFLRASPAEWAPPEALLLCWAGHAASAAAYLHSRGVAHLDIKPDNLFFPLATGDGSAGNGSATCNTLAASATDDASLPLPLRRGYKVLLGDLGSALVMARHAGMDIAARADDRYIAPEHVASYAADVFSLGATLFDLVMDIEMPRSPQKMWFQIRAARPGTLAAYMRRRRTPESLVALVERMMAPDPAARPAMADVVAYVETALAKCTAPPSPAAEQSLLAAATSSPVASGMSQQQSHPQQQQQQPTTPQVQPHAEERTPVIDPVLARAGTACFSDNRDHRSLTATASTVAGEHTRQFSDLLARAVQEDEESHGNVSMDASADSFDAGMFDGGNSNSTNNSGGEQFLLGAKPLIPQLAEGTEAQRQMLLARSSSSFSLLSPSIGPTLQLHEDVVPHPLSLDQQQQQQLPPQQVQVQPQPQQQFGGLRDPFAPGPSLSASAIRPRKLFCDSDDDDERGNDIDFDSIDEDM